MDDQRKVPATAWRPGESGNPRGRPPGVRNHATLLAQALIDSEAESIVRTVINAALAGDMAAARLIVDRLVPPVRERTVSLAMPDVGTAAGVDQAQGAILAAVAGGELTPGEATALAGVVEARRKALETLELERRISTLEARHAAR